MKFWRELRVIVALLAAAVIACPPARALVTLNESHDHIYVTGTFGVSRDSNIFANHDNQGDFVYTSSLVADYTRVDTYSATRVVTCTQKVHAPLHKQ